MNTETLFHILLIIHIVAGSIAFFVAPFALATYKGGTAHRRWGRTFFWGMTVVAATALVMAPLHNNIFLTLVAVFSFYLAFSGYRALYRKDFYKTHHTAPVDWIVASLNTLFSIVLLIIGIRGLPGAFGIISVVFGLLGARLGIRDIKSFITPETDKTKWFFSHMTGMIGAYIAAVSAFSAVNFNFDWLPVPVQWLWPSAIGVPLMIVWKNKFRKKFENGKKIREIAKIQIGAEDDLKVHGS